MILVAGLGNPGKGYASSRHNIGFIVIDELAKRLGVSVKKKGFRSHYAQAPIDEKKLIIAVYDEMDLSLGSIKVKVGGGSAGHKGIQSIINSLGDSDFIRVRVGIGKPVQKSEVIDHVLSQFEKEEKKLVKDAIVKAADAVIEIVQRGAESAMNKFNKNPK